MKSQPSLSQEEKIEFYRDAVRRYITAVNDKNLDRILALFATDAQVHDPAFSRSMKGHMALRDFYAGVITRAQLEIVGPIRGSFGNVVAAPVLARLSGVEVDVITLTAFNADGLIAEYTAYWGPSDRRNAVFSHKDQQSLIRKGTKVLCTLLRRKKARLRPPVLRNAAGRRHLALLPRQCRSDWLFDPTGTRR